MMFLRSLMRAAGATLAVLTAGAAEIRWSVHDITGNVTDVSTSGTLVDARGGVNSASFEINGVSFDNDPTIDQPQFHDSIESRAAVSNEAGDSNRAYYELLRHVDRINIGEATITFDNLVVGHDYQIQIWASDDAPPVDWGIGLVVNNGAGNAPDPTNPGHAVVMMKHKEKSPGQYALGTFTADAGSQSVKVRKWKNLNTPPHFETTNTFVNAVQLRDLGLRRHPARSQTVPLEHVSITRHLYDPPSDRYFLEWTSRADETYAICLLGSGAALRTCIAASVTGHQGKTTFGPFANPRPGNSELRFEVGPPDATAPICLRAWGSGRTISLHFSEAMHPGTALEASNFTVIGDDGQPVVLTKATFHSAGDTVELATAVPLQPGSRYTVKMRGLTDTADLPLDGPPIRFRTWDDNPQGVRVFILAGQSNMVGHGRHDPRPGTPGSLRQLVEKDPQHHGHLVDAGNQWVRLPNMMFWWNRAEPGANPQMVKGEMTPGYGADADSIGPEFGFGMALQQTLSVKPVLVIKTAWDRQDLHTALCPPDAEATRDGRTGLCYRAMMEQVHEVLDHLDTEFPLFAGLGYQLCGFGLYLDPPGAATTSADDNPLATFTGDLRAEVGNPQLPVCIATATPEQAPATTRQLVTVDTRPLLGSGGTASDDPASRHHDAQTLYRIGEAMGRAMVGMLGK